MKIEEAMAEAQRMVAALKERGYETTSVDIDKRAVYVEVRFEEPSSSSGGKRPQGEDAGRSE